LLQWTLRHELQRATAKDLEGKADVVQHFLYEAKEGNALQGIKHHLDDVLIGDGQIRIWLVGKDVMLYGGNQRPVTQLHGNGHLVIFREDGVALLGKSFRPQGSNVLPVTEVLIGTDTRSQEALIANFRNALLIMFGLGVTAAVVLGSWVASRELRPVRELSEQAAAITPATLSMRLSEHSSSAELEVLVQSFNRVLDRMQAAYEHLQGFSADVAHELRTPLATLINGSEITLSRTRSQSELVDTLSSNLEELRQLAAMTNDMLFLANADRGGTAQSLSPVDLALQATEVIEYFEATLLEAQVTARVIGRECADANAPLIRRALVNLLGNAVRFTSPGREIEVRLDRTDQDVRIAVRNPGVPSDPSALPHLFERFFRGDAARARSGDHHGLGLAIVRAVAVMHGGSTFASATGSFTEIGITIKRYHKIEIAPHVIDNAR
jgi:two-component system heavy metal sensor histidine kinase CusS